MFPPIQPSGPGYFLASIPFTIPKNVSRLFYLSWEDALWDILKNKNMRSGSTILLPEFFCGHVAENMGKQGLICKWYPVNKFLEVDETLFIDAIQKHKPQLIVIFNAIGIKNRLLLNTKKWKSHIPHDSIIIEDAANQIVNPNEISLISNNHIIIDSLRKTTPIQGSNIYGADQFLNYSPHTSYLTLLYQLQTYFLWFWYQFFLARVNLISLNLWNKSMNKLSEIMMFCGYNILGSNTSASPGLSYFYNKSNTLNFQYIKKIKKGQVERYRKGLKKIIIHSPFYVIPFPVDDSPDLRGYPIGLEYRKAKQFIKAIRSQGLLLRPELDDGPWSTKYKMIALPLGPHMTETEQESVISVIINTAKQFIK